MTGATHAIPVDYRHPSAIAVYARSIVVAVATIAAVAALLAFGDRVQHKEEARRVGERLEREFAAIKQGRTEEIFIYEPELLAMIAANPQTAVNATTLVFSMTDFSDPRFAEVARLKALQNVAINCSRNADAMLGYMRGMESVEKLWIEESPISKDGVAALAAMPNLKHVHFEQPLSADQAGLLRTALPNVNLRMPYVQPRESR